ncbi:MAG: 2-phospho-L-lactate transferase [Alphaproteobacteria bacterium]|nr:2-phospho-L-lactate transferase [Alphaproteobacteria bacterium]
MAPRVVALSGGIGGAKLALGLARLLGEDDLLVIANTGDDFHHLGFHISPDVDTLIYTLAGLSDPEQGWGRRDETWSFMEALDALGGETWFRLGDRDLALHVERSGRLARGETLTTVMELIAHRFGVRHRIVPMSDDPVPTIVLTDHGDLAFQHYFVRERCRPRVRGFRYRGAETARPQSLALEALRGSRLEAVVLCPSNPFISIDPILAIPGLRAAIESSAAPVIAVSPIIAGAALKGPTAKIMAELDLEVSALGIARHYRQLLNGIVIDEKDRHILGAIVDTGIAGVKAETVMVTESDKVAVAEQVVDFARHLAAVPTAAAG